MASPGRADLLVKTGISLGLGCTTGLLCYLFGVDFWPLWAVPSQRARRADARVLLNR